MNSELINIKIQDRADEEKEFRFNILLNFFTENEEKSIGHVRVQMRSPRDEGLRVSVINWEEPSTICFEKNVKYLGADSPGDKIIDLTLILDISGNLWIWLNETVETPLKCKAEVTEFLNKADRVVAQWVGLRHGGKPVDEEDLFTVQYRIGRKPGELVISNSPIST